MTILAGRPTSMLCRWAQVAHAKWSKIVLNGPRLFGMENEPPDDLLNIFYRCVRYTIFMGRKRAATPELRYFVSLVKDELKLKYSGNKILRHADNPCEKKAIAWMMVQMGWVLHNRRASPN